MQRFLKNFPSSKAKAPVHFSCAYRVLLLATLSARGDSRVASFGRRSANTPHYGWTARWERGKFSNRRKCSHVIKQTGLVRHAYTCHTHRHVSTLHVSFGRTLLEFRRIRRIRETKPELNRLLANPGRPRRRPLSRTRYAAPRVAVCTAAAAGALFLLPLPPTSSWALPSVSVQGSFSALAATWPATGAHARTLLPPGRRSAAAAARRPRPHLAGTAAA